MTNLSAAVTITPQNPSPILLIGNHSLQTSILANILETELQLTCQAIELDPANPQPPSSQLLLIDCNSFSSTAAHTLLRALDKTPNLSRVALLNTNPQSNYEDLAAWPQIKGIFYHDTNQQQLINGLKEILNNGLWLPRRITQHLLEKYRQSPRTSSQSNPLTKREQQILKYLVDGSTNHEIAKVIHVSEHTIKSHLYNIFKKIGVRNRLQACNWAKEHST